IPKNDGKDEARDLLIKILDTFANKFVTLNLVFADIQRQQRKKKAAASDSNGRFLFRNLVTGLKPIIQWLKECNPPLPSNSKAPIQQSNSVA
ncbi:27018_t:CDS:2, partial [Racocetra persica]